MAREEKDDNGWVLFGLGALGAAAGTMLLKPYIEQMLKPKSQTQTQQAGPESSGSGDYYSDDSVEQMISILAAGCGGGDPVQVREQLTNTRMAEVQQLLGLAERYQITQDPGWKNAYEQKMKELCFRTINALKAGKMGPTGNLIPAYGQIPIPTQEEGTQQQAFYVKAV